MSDITTKYSLTIQVLSPLHVGSGATLMQDLDYRVREDKVYVFDQDALMDLVLSRAEDSASADESGAVAEALMEMTLDDLERAGYLVSSDYYPESSLFRYVLRGRPTMREIQEQIKDVFGRPYLPGSSLKGGFRTAMAWWAFGQRGMQLDVTRLPRSRKWAGQEPERAIFGKDPNHDLMRTWQVSDSPSLDIEALGLTAVRVYPTARETRRGLDLSVEVLRSRTQLGVEVKLDEYLFDSQANKELGFGDRRQWLTGLPAICREHARQRIANELTYFQGRPDAAQPLRFYQALQRRLNALPEDGFLLQLSWGAGWDAKTFGSHLREDASQFDRLIRDYRLSRGRRRPGAPFPSSRRLVLRGGQPAGPMGWVELEMKRVV